jgi:hypothetical protein
LKAARSYSEKQKRAVLGLTFTADGPSAFGSAIEAQIKHKPQDPEYQAAEKVIQAGLKAMAIAAMDFVTVPMITFSVLYCFFGGASCISMSQGIRQLMGPFWF